MTEDQLHPNWKALATVHIPYKVFVREGTSYCVAEKSKNKDNLHKISIENSGEEIKKFYDTLVTESSKSLSNKNSLKVKSTREEYHHKQRPTVHNAKNNINDKRIPFNKNKFFRAAMTNDLKTMQNFINLMDNINCCDEFGWTALMMAACGGSIDVFKYLLDNGADINIKDKKGNTASSLAMKTHHCNEIVNIINKKNEEENVKNIHHQSSYHSSFCINQQQQKESKKRSKDNTKFYCKICNKNFKVELRYLHELSIIHQFNANKSENYRNQRFNNISNSNRGLKLMLKQGWDKTSGLGPLNDGQLYPVKTVIRKDRTGLGIEQDSPKVTHFKPNDLSAIKFRSTLSSRRQTRKELKRQKLREKRKEERLRMELC